MSRTSYNYWDELERTRVSEQRRINAHQQASMVSPDQAALMSELTNFYPTVPPGVIRPLAMEGYGPDDPVTMAAITMAAFQEEEERGEYGARWGDDIRSSPPMLNYDEDLAHHLGYVTLPVDTLSLPDSHIKNPRKIDEETLATLRDQLESSATVYGPGEHFITGPDTVTVSESAAEYLEKNPRILDEKASDQLAKNEVQRMSTEELMSLARRFGWVDENGYLVAKQGSINLTDNIGDFAAGAGHYLADEESQRGKRAYGALVANELYDRIQEVYPYHDVAENFDGTPTIFFETDPYAAPPLRDDQRDEIQHLKDLIGNVEDQEELDAIRDAYVGQAPMTLAAAGGLDEMFDYDPIEASRGTEFAGIPGLEQLVGATEGLVEEGVRPAMLAGLTTLEAIPQEIQGLARTTYAGLKGEGFNFQSQSNLGIAIPRLIRGEHVDMGSGFLPDPYNPEHQVNRERQRREQTYGEINDRTITLGRILANGVGFQPDTRPYQILSGTVDGTVLMADPFLLSKTTKIANSRRLFYAQTPVAKIPYVNAGGFSTHQLYVHGPTAEKFLTSRKGSGVVRRLTELEDAYDVSRLTNGKLPEDVAHRIARTRTTDETFDVLKSEINRGKIRETTQLREQAFQRGFNSARDISRETYQSLKHPIDTARQSELVNEAGRGMSLLTNSDKFSQVAPTRRPRSIRMLAKLPEKTVDFENPAQVTRTLERVLINAKATDADHRKIYNLMAEASAGNSRNAMNRAVDETLTIVNRTLGEHGIYDQDVARYVTRTDKASPHELDAYVQQISESRYNWKKINVGGGSKRIPGPHLPLEHHSRYRSLPSQRNIRRLTSKYNFLTSKQGMELLPKIGPKVAQHRAGRHMSKRAIGEPRIPVYALNYTMQNIWKPLQLFRPAYPLRVLGEAEIRMASADLSSLFKHPLDYISWVIADDKRSLARLADKLTPGVQRKGVFGVDGELMDSYNEFQAAMTRMHGNRVYDSNATFTNKKTVYARDNIDHSGNFERAWSERIAMLHHDPLARKVLSTPNRKDSVKWFMGEGGAKYRKTLQDAHPGNLQTKAEVNRFIKSIEDYAKNITGGNSDLLDALRTGKLDGVNIFKTTSPDIDPKFRGALKKRKETAAPEFVWGDEVIETGKLAQGDDFVDTIFHHLMGVPDDVLSRAPTFRQYYWRHATELMPMLNKSEQATVLANAKKANLSKHQMRNLERQATRHAKVDFTGTKPLTLTEYNDIIKSYALEDTNQLLYQLSERGQFWDAMRVVVPFGDAWQEIVTRWAKLATFRGPFGIPLPGSAGVTGAKTMRALQDPDFGELVGAPDGQGFFWENEHGDLVFVYPGSHWLSEAFTGEPIPISSPVQGLNMFGTFFPGTGPAAQVPAAYFIHNKPDYDFLRRELFPYGFPENPQDFLSHAQSQMLPTWARNLYTWTQSPESDKAFASTVMSVDDYLASTGQYGDSREEKQRRLADATSKARRLYLMRGLASAILPSPPSIEHLLQDESGDLHRMSMVTERYANLIEETGDPDEALHRFVDEFGWDAVSATRPKSATVPGTTIDSVEGREWAEANPELRKQFPYTYAFFAPQGEFDSTIFQLQFTNGERRELTPEERQMQFESFMGHYNYRRAHQMVEGRDDEAATQWLRDVRFTLEQLFPGYGFENGVPGTPRGATDQDMISELEMAVNNPKVLSTDVGVATSMYMVQRQKAIELSLERQHVTSPTGWTTAKSTEYLRAWLEAEAHQLMLEFPEFEHLWMTVFSRETRGPGPRTFEETWEQ